MQEIVCLEPNRRKQMTIKRTVSSVTSMSGTLVGSILIGMYLDHKFFNNTGTSVIVATVIGILLVVASVVKLVIISRDNK